MIRDDERTCDVCDRPIPHGAWYHQVTCASVSASLLPRGVMQPLRFTRNPDGTVALDVCASCDEHVSRTHCTRELREQ
jgi:hypothetical protein